VTHRPPIKDAYDLVALVIALGLVTAVNLMTFAVLWDAVRSDTPGLSENATQILTGTFGGMIGILGAGVGYRQTQNGKDDPDAADPGP
jgi:hypothetical protein